MSTRVEVLVAMLDPDLDVPAYGRPGDAGLDLRAREACLLEPGQRAVIPTGVSIALPAGYVGLVCPRSGLAASYGLGLVNAPGIIDAGYRGEISVIVINHDTEVPCQISRGDRIAQLIVTPFAIATMSPVSELPGTHRGSGGFGSTGGR